MTRAPAKRYLRSLDLTGSDAVEAQCVEYLIAYHRRNAGTTAEPSWFGRLLWKLFGRWL